MNNNLNRGKESLRPYVVVHPFGGDPAQSQLVLAPGQVVWADPIAPQNTGAWWWGFHQQQCVNGWFPPTYVQSQQVTQQQSNTNSQNGDDGFGGAVPMGGAWSSGYNGGSTLFGNANGTRQREHRQQSQQMQQQQRPQQKQHTTTVPVPQGKKRWFSNRGSTKPAAAPTSNFTRQRIADTNTHTPTQTPNTNTHTPMGGGMFQEIGHRFRDMRHQHEQNMDQRADVKTTTTRSANNPKAQTTHTSSLSQSQGILPGRKQDTVTATEQQHGGATRTTTITTSRASGGWLPQIGGKTTTTQVVERDAQGRTTQVHTEQKGGVALRLFP